MTEKTNVILLKTLLLWIILFLFIINGCQHVQVRTDADKAKELDVKRIVLTGFKPALYQGEALANTTRSVAGYTCSTDAKLLEKAGYMTSMIYESMRKEKGYELIAPDRSGEALSRIKARYPGITPTEIPGRIAGEFQADAVLTGYLFRWRDREGMDYAAGRSASIAFDLCLVDPKDGTILWQGRFDKTQRALSENLLDVRTFYKGKGRWMTAEELAELGLEDLVRELLLFMDKGKGAAD
jgi:hypothetical protein